MLCSCSDGSIEAPKTSLREPPMMNETSLFLPLDLTGVFGGISS
jgi:hypothetical protein